MPGARRPDQAELLLIVRNVPFGFVVLYAVAGERRTTSRSRVDRLAQKVDQPVLRFVASFRVAASDLTCDVAC